MANKLYCKICKSFCSKLDNEIMRGHHKQLLIVPESLLDIYDLQEQIGKGATSVVFKSLHKLEDEYYALKLLDLNDSENSQEKIDENYRDLLNEIKINKKLQNEFIIKYITSIPFPSTKEVAMVMELADDCLQNRINTLSVEEAMVFILQICRGLDYLHNNPVQKVIHRDLKPQNLLIISNKIKICDFGVSKIKTRDQLSLSRVAGTPTFMAPEMIEMSDFITEKVDIWSLGIIIHKLLTNGKHPFGNEKDNIGLNIRKGKYMIDKNISNEKIRNILEKCFIMLPEMRIGVNEIIKNLETQTINKQIKNEKPQIIPEQTLDFPKLQEKYNDFLDKVASFADITIISYDSFCANMGLNFLASQKNKYILIIEIIGSPLQIKKNECGLTLKNCIILTSLLKTSFIADAKIIGLSISIDPPWYPFEYDFVNKKGTNTAKILFDTVFQCPYFEIFDLKLTAKYQMKDNRFAVNLTDQESDCLKFALMNENSRIKTLILQFMGLEGAFGILLKTCINIFSGLIKSKIDNFIFNVFGNLNNSFNGLEEINERITSLKDQLKYKKNFDNFIMNYN